MTEFEVIRKDAIRLATVVVNLSKKYKPFQARVRGLGFRALSTRQLWELEHVCRELRTVYCKLLELECDHATPQGERPTNKCLAQSNKSRRSDHGAGGNRLSRQLGVTG
jgi:hypothetical protein